MSRQPKLSEETIRTSIEAIEAVIRAKDSSEEIDESQKLFSARQELLSLIDGGAPKKPRTTTARKRGLPREEEATA